MTTYVRVSHGGERGVLTLKEWSNAKRREYRMDAGKFKARKRSRIS